MGLFEVPTTRRTVHPSRVPQLAALYRAGEHWTGLARYMGYQVPRETVANAEERKAVMRRVSTQIRRLRRRFGDSEFPKRRIGLEERDPQESALTAAADYVRETGRLPGWLLTHS
ncbi:MAG: hypothetical protein AAGM22_27750 [Acidobacteriota bacterium]